MASVTSLGLHQPTALDYAVREQILPPDPPGSLYEWDIVVDHDEDGGGAGEDELLITSDTVVWSRGCVFRKCFGFRLEKETITQALLAYFPNTEHAANLEPHDDTKGVYPGDTQAKRKRQNAPTKDKALSKALVVFLKTQAHIYHLDGTSHVVHMPFEVESACAAPQGVVIQRKQRLDHGLSASLKFPKVPPNSFISNQVSPVSMRTSQQSTFSTETLGRPKALPVRLSSNLDNTWEVPTDQNDSHWPRLVMLTDPLLELGLVVTKPNKHTRATRNRRGSEKSSRFLGRAEEIVHIEAVSHPASIRGRSNGKVTLAVTINRETSMYTVWKFTYIRNDDPFVSSRKQSRKSTDRRRSSMQPGRPSGATTPLQPNLRESFGAPLPGKRSRKSERIEKVDRALENLESSLGIDKDTAATRRTSRRVSSMLARADLSASQDRTSFSDQPQVPNHPNTRRDTSHGSQRNRASGMGLGGISAAHNSNSLGSFLEAPVDDLLDELRSGGDFEGFHTMGLDDHDFDGLAEEVLFTKIHSVPIDNSNVRYSLSKKPARTQCKIFFLCGPESSADEGHCRWQVLIGIQDPMEKRLQLLTLHLQSRMLDGTPRSDPEVVSVTFGQLRKAQNVIDSCKIQDGHIAMILVLSQGANGQRELSLQAPWSQLTTVTLPGKLSLANPRSLDYGGSLVNREVGVRRAITPILGEIGGLRHPKLRGVVDILDEDTNKLHQIRIQLQPTSPFVTKILNLLPTVMPSSSGDKLLAGWWDILGWLRHQDDRLADPEWSAVVVLVLMGFLALGSQEMPTPVQVTSPQRRSRGFLRSSSGAQVDMSDWDTMNCYESSNASTHPPWIENRAWKWMQEEDDGALAMFQPTTRNEHLDFLASHVKYTHAFMASAQGEIACGPQGYLPTGPIHDDENRARYAQNMFLALHLLMEEDKLAITSNGKSSPGHMNLRAVMLLVTRWMNWTDWASLYELDMPFDWPEDIPHTSGIALAISISQYPYWSVLDWISAHLSQAQEPNPGLPAILSTIPPNLLKRITMFDSLFRTLKLTGISPFDFVSAMHQSGINPFILETLPDAVLVPLQDAITQCQANPSPTWPRKMLELVDRSDVVSAFASPHIARPQTGSVFAPTHLASWDFNSLCQNVMDFNDAPADDVAESDKQAVIRAIIKEDRRLEEIRSMLNTTKPRVVRLDPEAGWTEPIYLEKQKEIVARLATNTLSIPVGRGLMNYGLRFPLLTQKFHINGFVLNCAVKPTNTTVGVDKSLFTEEKIAWAFFHSGVAAGLSISRQAKGIDTSWILYNKPGNDLNNRHAGFLLALGLNGHLKGMAKWVAFKYLTPKHTMTSIGLLLGLAASYIGTMDSLITRLLSVHVTRMLPRGAAELNLSPLTQTTGIMGIGLLYCNSQHRRMSEIMMSEIEHIETDDDEEPLRSECYRLASGFALGFINLGKGTDLKGLHDMRITEKLLTLASTTKTIEHVHVLDRSIPAAVIAIALIYMKSEDRIVARKIDVPEATLQFDYIRPDILLLRTVAKHLILWSEVDPTHDWVRKNLPRRYQPRLKSPMKPFDDPSHGPLDSTQLPFLTILAGLCFSVALRFAGSGDLRARDLLHSYLLKFYSYCRLPNPKANFDDRCVHVTARMCLDVVAVSCAIVMAGTCDLKILRVLRSLHARNDPETVYGSHMATHMAIGILSLGCGTQTFSTSNIAVASLLVAFYPVFPDSVQDHKSHLQAFRHFWVLATDPRCLVTKDVATNAPVSVPISVTLKDGQITAKTTPCLLPPVEGIASIRTLSPEFWNLQIDLTAHPEYAEAFQRTQSLFLRRRPISDNPFAATILALGRQNGQESVSAEASSGTGSGAGGVDGDGSLPLEWLFSDAVPSLGQLTHAERDLVLDRGVGGPDPSDAATTAVDSRLSLEEAVRVASSRDDLITLKGLFAWTEWRAERRIADTERAEERRLRQKMHFEKQAQQQQEARTAAQKGKGVAATVSKPDTPQRQKALGKKVEEDHEILWDGGPWLRESIVEGLKGTIWLAGRE